jgi:indolepyruvate ferredoxin oxidoreductase
VASEIPTGANLTYKLHPPVLRALGRKTKIGLGPRTHVALRLLAKGRRLRGTRLDPFGRAHVRQVERALLAEYSGIVSRLAADLDIDGYERAMEIASLPELVRGYEDVKLASVAVYQARLDELGVARS